LLSWLLTGNLAGSLALGLVLGAISSATAPAATVDVLWEYKTRGILTRTILAIVALDDGLALLLYGFATSFAGALLGGEHSSWLASLAVPLWEIFGAIALGAAIGLILVQIFKYIDETDKLLTFTVASVALTIGLSVVFGVESILAAMVLGATLVNLRPRRSRDAFELIEAFSPPIYVLFFVLVGARLNLTSLPLGLVALDIMEPVAAKVTPETSLADAFEKADKYDLDYLPVVDKERDGALAGLLDCPAVRRSLAAEVLSRQEKADHLHLAHAT